MNVNSRGGSACSARRRFAIGAGGAAAILLAAMLPSAASAAVDSETQFVLNSFSFLVWGALVMWMCAGFTMLEAGSVRTKNASVICLKNIGLYSIAGLTFYLVGYNLMYVGVEEGGWFGSLQFLYGSSADELALLQGQEEALAAVVDNGYATMSDWFFQMVFVATAASIVSGTLAERVKLWSFFSSSPFLRQSSTRSSGRGPGAADGCPRWVSRTLRAPPSSTPPADGPRLPAP